MSCRPLIRQPRARKAAGFTLVELVTVLAILAVVSTMGTMAYFQVDQQWRQAHTRTELHAAADAIFAQMHDDLNGLLSPLRTGAVIEGENDDYAETDEASRYWRITFADDEVTLPVEVYDTARQFAVRQRVTYRVARDTDPPTLLRDTAPLQAKEAEDEETTAAPVLPASRAGVLALNIEYARDGQWQDAWEGAGTPEAIRVSLTLLDSLRPYVQVSRKTVIPIHVD